MSESAIIPPGDGDSDGAGDVRGLDARGVVEEIVASRRAADAHEARVLALAVHFVDLHPVTPQHPAASWDPDEKLPVGCKPKAAKPQSQSKSGAKQSTSGSDERTDRIAGEGTPGVAEYAVEELGAALGVSYRSALQLVADALELCYRLPRL